MWVGYRPQWQTQLQAWSQRAYIYAASYEAFKKLKWSRPPSEASQTNFWIPLRIDRLATRLVRAIYFLRREIV